MRRLAFLLGLLVAACAEAPPPPPAPGSVPSPPVYHMTNGGLVGCTTWGFETICRGH